MKALTPKNIKCGFRAVGIQPFNKEALVANIRAHEIFQHNQRTREDSKEEEGVPSEACEEETNL